MTKTTIFLISCFAALSLGAEPPVESRHLDPETGPDPQHLLAGTIHAVEWDQRTGAWQLLTSEWRQLDSAGCPAAEEIYLVELAADGTATRVQPEGPRALPQRVRDCRKTPTSKDDGQLLQTLPLGDVRLLGDGADLAASDGLAMRMELDQPGWFGIEAVFSLQRTPISLELDLHLRFLDGEGNLVESGQPTEVKLRRADGTWEPYTTLAASPEVKASVLIPRAEDYINSAGRVAVQLWLQVDEATGLFKAGSDPPEDVDIDELDLEWEP